MTQPPFPGNDFFDQIDSVARKLTGNAYRLKRDDPTAPGKFTEFIAQSEQEFGATRPIPQVAQPTQIAQPTQVFQDFEQGGFQQPGEMQFGVHRPESRYFQFRKEDRPESTNLIGQTVGKGIGPVAAELGRGTGAFGRWLGEAFEQQAYGSGGAGTELYAEHVGGKTPFDIAFKEARDSGMSMTDAFEAARGFDKQFDIGNEKTGYHGVSGFFRGVGDTLRGDLGVTEPYVREGGTRRPMFTVGLADLASEVVNPQTVLPGVGAPGLVTKPASAAVRGTRAGAGAALRKADEAAAAIGRTGVGNVLDPVPPQTVAGRAAGDVVPRGVSDAVTGQPFEGVQFRGFGRETAEEAFDPRVGAQENIFGDAVYSTPSEGFAKEFGPNIEQVTTRLENPLVISTDTEYAALAREAGLRSSAPATSEEVNALRAVITGRGHDGVIIRVPDSELTGKRLQQVFGDDTVVDFAGVRPDVTTAARQADAAARGAGGERVVREHSSPSDLHEAVQIRGRLDPGIHVAGENVYRVGADGVPVRDPSVDASFNFGGPNKGLGNFSINPTTKNVEEIPAEIAPLIQGTKVVDHTGKPLRVFHGTPHEFDEFVANTGTNYGVNSIEGIYFDPRRSGAFGQGLDPNTRIVEAYVNLQNPSIGTRNLTREELIAKGHDGVINVDADGEIWEVIAFDNSTIHQVSPTTPVRQADVAAGGAGGVGQPVRVFHGSDKVFDISDIESAAPRYPGGLGEGVYVAPDAETAGFYGRNVQETELRLKNPLEIDPENFATYREPPELVDAIQRGEVDSVLIGEAMQPFDVRIGGKWHQVRDAESLEDIGALAREAGHDGVIATRLRGMDEILVLDKSALGTPTTAARQADAAAGGAGGVPNDFPIAARSVSGAPPEVTTAAGQEGVVMVSRQELAQLADPNVPIARLRQEERAYLDNLKSQISEQGLQQPLEVQRMENGNYMVMEGSHRLAVLEELGINEVPIRITQAPTTPARQAATAAGEVAEEVTPVQRVAPTDPLAAARAAELDEARRVSAAGGRLTPEQQAIIDDVGTGRPAGEIPVADGRAGGSGPPNMSNRPTLDAGEPEGSRSALFRPAPTLAAKDDPIVQRAYKAIRDTKPATEESLAALSKGRQRQIARGGQLARQAETFAEVGTAAQRGFAGEIPRPEFESIAPLFSPEDIESLLSRIWGRGSVLEFANEPPGFINWRKFNADVAFKKLFHPDSAVLPTPSELELLERVYGPEIVRAVLSKKKLGDKAWDYFLDAWNLPRSLLSTADISSTLRQAGMLGPGNPKQFKDAFKLQLKAFANEEYALAARNKMEADTDFLRFTTKSGRMEEVGVRKGQRLQITVLGEAGERSRREEMFMTSLAGRLPIVRASERAYVTMLNELRFSVMKKWVEVAELTTGKAATDAQLDAIAEFINYATGRGSLWKAEGAAPLLNGLGFSPRLAVSRFQVPLTVLRRAPGVRKQVASNLVKYAGLGAMVLFLLDHTPGVDVVANPNSSDYGKIRIGKTRFDLFAGNLQMVRFLSQLVSGKKQAIGTRSESAANRADIVTRYLRTKAHPSLGFGIDVASEENFLGEDFFLDPESFTKLDVRRNPVLRQVTPMIIQDIVEAYKESGPLMAVGAGVASTLGVGVSSFSTPEDASQELWGEPITDVWPFQQEQAKDLFVELQKDKGERDPGVFDQADINHYEAFQDIVEQFKSRDIDKRTAVNRYFSINTFYSGLRKGLSAGIFGGDLREEPVFPKAPSGGTDAEKAALQEYYDSSEPFESPSGFNSDEWAKVLKVLERKWQTEGTLQYVLANTHTRRVPQELLDLLKRSSRKTWNAIERSSKARAAYLEQLDKEQLATESTQRNLRPAAADNVIPTTEPTKPTWVGRQLGGQ